MSLRQVFETANTNQRLSMLGAFGQPIVRDSAIAMQRTLYSRLEAIDVNNTDETVARELRHIKSQLIVYQELEQFASFLMSKEAKAYIES